MKYLLVVSMLLFVTCSCCRNPNKTIDTENVKIKDYEFAVQLKGKVKTDQILGAYQRYKLELVKEIDRSKNIWLFGYDEQLIGPDEMFDILKYSQFVSTASIYVPDEGK